MYLLEYSLHFIKNRKHNTGIVSLLSYFILSKYHTYALFRPFSQLYYCCQPILSLYLRHCDFLSICSTFSFIIFESYICIYFSTRHHLILPYGLRASRLNCFRVYFRLQYYMTTTNAFRAYRDALFVQLFITNNMTFHRIYTTRNLWLIVLYLLFSYSRFLCFICRHYLNIESVNRIDNIGNWLMGILDDKLPPIIYTTHHAHTEVRLFSWITGQISFDKKTRRDFCRYTAYSAIYNYYWYRSRRRSWLLAVLSRAACSHFITLLDGTHVRYTGRLSYTLPHAMTFIFIIITCLTRRSQIMSSIILWYALFLILKVCYWYCFSSSRYLYIEFRYLRFHKHNYRAHHDTGNFSPLWEFIDWIVAIFLFFIYIKLPCLLFSLCFASRRQRYDNTQLSLHIIIFSCHIYYRPQWTILTIPRFSPFSPRFISLYLIGKFSLDFGNSLFI